MRTALILYSGVMTLLITVSIIVSITMRSSYSELIIQSLDDSMEYSIALLQVDRANLKTEYSGTGLGDAGVNFQGNWGSEYDSDLSENEKFKKDFVTYLASNIDSRIKSLDVDIYGADADKGLLSVDITATFLYPTGTEGKVTSSKTVILNKWRVDS